MKTTRPDTIQNGQTIEMGTCSAFIHFRRLCTWICCISLHQTLYDIPDNYISSSGARSGTDIWRPCLSKHLCHQTTSKNLNPYFVHLLPSYKEYQEILFFVCPYRVCFLLFQLKIRIPSLYVYTHVLKIPFASS